MCPSIGRLKHLPCRIIDVTVDFDDRLRAALDRALADVRAVANAEVEEVRQSAELSTAAFRGSAVRLSNCIQAIDEAPSLGAVLGVVAGCARLEAGRAAMILVKDGTLSTYPSRGQVPSDQARLATSAAQKAAPVIEPEAAAFPISLGGQVVAVLSTAAPSTLPVQTALDLLARHAGRVLEAMTVCQITGLTPLPAVADGPGKSAP
jgi:hypothetical protein